MSDIKKYALIIDKTNTDILKQKKFGIHHIHPVELIDNRYALRADILNETGESGLFPNALDGIEYEQVLWEDIVDLLPTYDDIEI